MPASSAHCESLRKTMIFTLAKPWQMLAKIHLLILANLCESLRNHELQRLAKACQTLRHHICKFARKLAKACEIIFVKACETRRKSICKFLPPGSGQACRSTCPLSVVILNIFRLVVIMIPKLIVSVIVLFFDCPKSFTIPASPGYQVWQLSANQPMMKYKASYTIFSSA